MNGYDDMTIQVMIVFFQRGVGKLIELFMKNRPGRCLMTPVSPHDHCIHWLAFGKHTKNYGQSPFYSWVNQLFLWPFSIAMFVYQRVHLYFSIHYQNSIHWLVPRSTFSITINIPFISHFFPFFPNEIPSQRSKDHPLKLGHLSRLPPSLEVCLKMGPQNFWRCW